MTKPNFKIIRDHLDKIQEEIDVVTLLLDGLDKALDDAEQVIPAEEVQEYAARLATARK